MRTNNPNSNIALVTNRLRALHCLPVYVTICGFGHVIYLQSTERLIKTLWVDNEDSVLHRQRVIKTVWYNDKM